jgi:hypothetical protein
MCIHRSAEAIIREQVAINGLHCYDIMWSFHKLEVTVTRGDVPEDSDEAGYVVTADFNLLNLSRHLFTYVCISTVE